MKFYLPFTNTKTPVTAVFEDHIDGRRYGGIDFATPMNTPILCSQNAADGSDAIVEFAGWDNIGYGILVVVRHGGTNNWKTRYAHLKSVNVKKGDRVRAGTLLGKSNNTGNSTGPHLHYEIEKKGNRVDPKDYFYYPWSAPKDDVPPPEPPPLEDAMIIDVSKYQVSMDFATAKDAGVTAVMLRATVGDDYQDPMFVPWYETARRYGLLVGAYHVVAPTRSPQAQLQSIQIAMRGKVLDFPFWLDVELEGIKPAEYTSLMYHMIVGLTNGNIVQYSDANKYWRQRMYDLYYNKYKDYKLVNHVQYSEPPPYPGVYLSPNSSRLLNLVAWFDYLPLWVAHYNVATPAKIPPWNFHVMHQYSADGNNQGAKYGAGSQHIDLNRWNSSIPPIENVAPPPPPPPPPPPDNCDELQQKYNALQADYNKLYADILEVHKDLGNIIQ